MKVNLAATVTVLVCICDVRWAVNLKSIVDNDLKESMTSESPTYTTLWKFNGSAEDIQAAQARLMLSYMNSSVDPCEDFYEYACGNWKNLHPIPKDNIENSVFVLLSNNIQNELREVLSQPVERNSQELSAEEKARLYFETCIDEEAINRRGVEPLLKFINELGGWPVLDENWSGVGFDWLQLAIKTSLLGHPSILSTDVDIDWKNSSMYSIYLGEPTLDLDSRDEYLNFDNDKHMEAYRALIVGVLRLLNVDPQKANATAKELVDFETELDSIRTGYTSDSYDSTSIEGLSKNYSNIDWLTYFSGVQETPLQPNQSIVMLTPDYYRNLTHILKQFEPRMLANYLVWRIVYKFLNAFDDRFEEVLHTFKKALTGQAEPLARWKECVKELNTNMEMATGAMFVRRYYDEDSRDETAKLLNDIKQDFRETLQEQNWIDERTKELALAKVNQTKLFVGYPDYILNPIELNKLYSDMEVISGQRFENILNLAKHYSRVQRKRFRDPVDKDFWSFTPAVANAYFDTSLIRIDVPMGVLQPPIFHKHFLRALNYGAIGFFVGHELTHGFDNDGREYDAAGNIVQWWSPETLEEFNKKAECFAQQYGKFSLDGIAVNGSLTKGENIADNGAIRQAFRVYQKWQDMNAVETMPGLNFTNNQLFFLGYAQVFCNAVRPESLESVVKDDSHSPGKFRVIGTLANFEEFSETFNCPAGSAMNPDKKCRLW